MRCLSLADALRAHGAIVEFVCRETPGNLTTYIESDRSFRVHRLPRSCSDHLDASATSSLARANCGAQWLIVDHYGLDYRWQRQLRPCTDRIMVIDDLANRRHDCDLLLDQNLHGDSTRYDGLVPSTCTTLLGPRFALLRPEFEKARARASGHRSSVERILISFGGSDPTEETVTALSQLHRTNLADRLRIDCVIGSNHRSVDRVARFAASTPNMTLHIQTPRMAYLMSKSDLGIGAGGSSVWERCCVGLPSLTVAVNDHQADQCRRLARAGYIEYLGHVSDGPIDYAQALRRSMEAPRERAVAAHLGMQLVDGQGSSRTMARMLEAMGR